MKWKPLLLMASRSRWLRVPAQAPAVNGIVASRRRRHGEDRDGSKNSPVDDIVYTAEDPQKADRIAAARRTENVCQVHARTDLMPETKRASVSDVAPRGSITSTSENFPRRLTARS